MSLHDEFKTRTGPLEAIAGVSCESCHGASKDWIAVHNDYGGPNITKAQETREHRLARFQQSIQLGMRNPVNVLSLSAKLLSMSHTFPTKRWLMSVGIMLVVSILSLSVGPKVRFDTTS